LKIRQNWGKIGEKSGKKLEKSGKIVKIRKIGENRKDGGILETSEKSGN